MKRTSKMTKLDSWRSALIETADQNVVVFKPELGIEEKSDQPHDDLVTPARPRSQTSPEIPMADTSHGERPPIDARRIKIMGYSERGALNTLLFEIGSAPNGIQLLQALLSRALFPFGTSPTLQTEAITAFLEQSLSDFGDGDLILLLETLPLKSTFFVESKVKTNNWSLRVEFDKFQKGLGSKLKSSNLFTQLYHKQRFVNAARCTDSHALHHGVTFPDCSTKAVRKIGENRVVLRAVKAITPYLQAVYYLALVPDKAADVRRFVGETLENFKPNMLGAWDVSNWCFLCWADVYEFCKSEGLQRTVAVLDFNEGQIY
jgi:hypothetical protein